VAKRLVHTANWLRRQDSKCAFYPTGRRAQKPRPPRPFVGASFP